MEEFEGRRILRSGWQGGVVRGRGVWIGGAIATLAGTGILLCALGVVATDPRSWHAPRWVGAAAGALFLAAGLWLLGCGTTHAVRGWRRRRLRAAHPDEPWRWDHGWQPERLFDDSYAQLGQGAVGLTLFALILAPLNWVAFLSPERPLPFQLGAGLFDVFFLFALGHTTGRLLQLLRHGRCRAALLEFPLRLGTRARIRLFIGADPALFDRLDVTLRCVREVQETVVRGRERRTTISCYELFAAEQVVENPGLHGTREQGIALAFDLPDGPPTDLGPDARRWWELELHAHAQGPDLRARILLPVYGAGVTAAPPGTPRPDPARSAAARRSPAPAP